MKKVNHTGAGVSSDCKTSEGRSGERSDRNDGIKDSYFQMSSTRGDSSQGTFFDISYIIKKGTVV